MSETPKHWLEKDAKKIPDSIRKIILSNGYIDKAENLHDFNTPMEYLFDVYEEFIDVSGQHDDYACGPCRQHILDEFKKLKPFLEELENVPKG